jgi:two-component system sensor histidine kinase KdpD
VVASGAIPEDVTSPAEPDDVVARPLARRWGRLSEYSLSIGVVALTTGIGLILRPRLQVIDIAMLFLLSVIVVASRSSRRAAILASVLSIAVFDFGFVPPYYTLDVQDPSFFLTFAVMLTVALLMTHLTARIREQAETARKGQRRAVILYDVSRELAGGESLADQIAIAERQVGRAARGSAHVFLEESPGDHGQRWQTDGLFESVDIRVAAAWAVEHNRSAGWSTHHCAEAEALVMPLRHGGRVMGLVVVRPEAPLPFLSRWELETAEALVDLAAATFEGALLAERHKSARAEVEAERLRTALLSSLSHDLRTPLGGIEGAASSLLQVPDGLPSEARRELAQTILEESRRMTRLVSNLLDMVRVESGTLAVQKAWQPLEEALGVALLRLEERLEGHPVSTQLPSGLPLVPIDELLIEQVFINLLENAAKYTPQGTPITVSAWTSKDAVVVEVADTGPGIPAGEEETIFRKFQRSSSVNQTGPAGGSGLGLTICRGIVAAHGGRIWLERRAGGGSAFRFSLPLEGPPIDTVPSDGAGGVA